MIPIGCGLPVPETVFDIASFALEFRANLLRCSFVGVTGFAMSIDILVRPLDRPFLRFAGLKTLAIGRNPRFLPVVFVFGASVNILLNSSLKSRSTNGRTGSDKCSVPAHPSIVSCPLAHTLAWQF
jgi:hypothetical protein